MNRIRFLVAPALAAALVLMTACGEKKPAAAQPETLRNVPVIQVHRATIPDFVEAVGTVRANQTAQLSAETVATVRAVQAAEGQHVRRGEVLIVLDDAQPRAAVDRAQAGVAASQQAIAAADADFNLAQATLNRYRSMFEKKSVSPHEMDEVEARFKAAQAHREAAHAAQSQAAAGEAQARAMLSYTRVRAPFDGVVTAKNVDPGALASPGVPLLTVEDTRTYRLEATVDESNLKFVKLGESVPLALDALDGELQGKVVQIVPAADPASRSFVVKVELPKDERLRSGLFGRARFPRGQRESIVVPQSAVLDRGQLKGVYLVAPDGLIGLRFVTLGKPSGDQVEILSGLSGAERLVVSHGDRDLAGKKLVN
jgi:RND family efflux transporter MFP subunit